MADTKVVEGTTVSKGTGLKPNVIGLLSWIFAPISSVIFLLTEKETAHWNEVKSNVMQSLYVGILVVILPSISWLLCGLPSIALFIYQVILAIKAYNGEKVEVPIIKDWVK
ncbi:hypothetical protein JW962_02755 [Candidatus Dojkabacteria bacterium]|nr:hypothetical protein [Candidatus Dojkabacteria bacterium]